jgi:peptidoglycan/xylan/chitin deacetylase (PgdA/CDA1 family)
MSWGFRGWLRLLAGLATASCIMPPTSAPPSSAAPGSAQSSALGSTSAATPARCGWPNGAKAAVSLTYDDALASQLRYALPVLQKNGIKATFFLSGGNIGEFAPLAAQGHELASHTLKHPCNAELAALDLTAMAAELDAGAAAVHALGASGKLSFAYPCGQTRIGPKSESYVPLVQARFRAARGVSPSVADPQTVDLFNVPALFPPTSSDGSDVLSFIERAEASAGWAVIGIHGVSEAGEYLQLAQAAHDKVVGYLAAHADRIWSAPFGDVADAIASCRRL